MSAKSEISLSLLAPRMGSISVRIKSEDLSAEEFLSFPSRGYAARVTMIYTRDCQPRLVPFDESSELTRDNESAQWRLLQHSERRRLSTMCIEQEVQRVDGEDVSGDLCS